jgi:hypothetical protein
MIEMRSMMAATFSIADDSEMNWLCTDYTAVLF